MSAYLERVKHLAAEVRKKLEQVEPIQHTDSAADILHRLDTHRNTYRGGSLFQPQPRAAVPRPTRPEPPSTSSRPQDPVPRAPKIRRPPPQPPSQQSSESLSQTFKHLQLPTRLVVLPDTDESLMEETRRSITQLRKSIDEPSKLVERKRAALAALKLRPKPINKP